MATSTTTVSQPAAASKLTELVLLARSARGASAVAIIRQATEHPALFAFAELLAAPGIVEMHTPCLAPRVQLTGTPHQPWLDVLRIFAYGTFLDYTARRTTLPELSGPQTTKLRMLTIVSLAFFAKNLSYDMLMARLGLESLRALEDLVMEAVYAGVLRAKLNQKDRTVEVEWAIGRDVRPSDLPAMVALLAHWHRQTSGLVESLDKRIADVGHMLRLAEQSRAEFETTVDQVRQRLSKRTPSITDGDRRGGDFSSQEYYDEDSRSRGKGRNKVARSGMSTSAAGTSTGNASGRRGARS